MRDDQRSPNTRGLLARIQNSALWHSVPVGSRISTGEPRRMARASRALLLTSGHRRAALGDHGVVASGKASMNSAEWAGAAVTSNRSAGPPQDPDSPKTPMPWRFCCSNPPPQLREVISGSVPRVRRAQQAQRLSTQMGAHSGDLLVVAIALVARSSNRSHEFAWRRSLPRSAQHAADQRRKQDRAEAP